MIYQTIVFGHLKSFRSTGYASGHWKGFQETYGNYMGLMGQREAHTSPLWAGAPSPWPPALVKERWEG